MSETKDEVPLHLVVPGLDPGEQPEGPNGALSKAQVLKILSRRAGNMHKALDAAEGPKPVAPRAEDLSLAAAIGELQQGFADAFTAATAEPNTKNTTVPPVEAAVIGAPGSVEVLPDGTLRRYLAGGRYSDTTPAQQKERDEVAANHHKNHKAALEAGRKKFGPDKESGWDTPPPSREKVARLLNLHNEHRTQALCTTCKHAVQIIQPVVDLGGIGGFHGIRTICSVVLDDTGKNLELEDCPVQYCSKHKFSVALVLRKAWLRWRTKPTSDVSGFDRGLSVAARVAPLGALPLGWVAFTQPQGSPAFIAAVAGIAVCVGVALLGPRSKKEKASNG